MAAFEFRDRAVYLPGIDTLVLADLHLGKAEASRIEFPVGEGEDLVDRFEALVDRFDPASIVVAGDLLHSFATLPRGVVSSVHAIERTTREAGAEVVVTPGNHDSMLGEVWTGATTPEYRVGDVVIAHGHEEPEASADCYVVGHDHPTIEIEGRRRPCYLLGDDHYRGAELLVLPSFTRLAHGVRVNGMSTGDFQTPLVRRADALRPIVRDADADETFEFPPLGEFRELL